MIGIDATRANTTNSTAVCAPEKPMDRRSGRVYTSKERMDLWSRALRAQATLSGSREHGMNDDKGWIAGGSQRGFAQSVVEDHVLLSQEFMEISGRPPLGG